MVSILVAAALCGCGSAAVVPTSEQVRACQTATACGIATDFDLCIQYFGDVAGFVRRTGTADFAPADIDCLAKAGSDCDAAGRCANHGAAPQSCSDSAGQCDGDVVHECFAGRTRSFDCAAVGLHCIADTMGGASCGSDRCSPDGGTCDLSGAKVLACRNGVQHPMDCAEDGAACAYSGPVAACVGVGHGCMTNTVCDGDVIVSCDSGREQRIDCGARGLHCTTFYRPYPAFECGNGVACDTATKASCDGAGQLHYCYLGTPLVADCKTSGLSGCNATGCVR